MLKVSPRLVREGFLTSIVSDEGRSSSARGALHSGQGTGWSAGILSAYPTKQLSQNLWLHSVVRSGVQSVGTSFIAYCAFDVVIGIKHGTATVSAVRACRRCAGDRSLRERFLVYVHPGVCTPTFITCVLACVAGSEDALHPSKAIGPVEGYRQRAAWLRAGLTKVSSTTQSNGPW